MARMNLAVTIVDGDGLEPNTVIGEIEAAVARGGSLMLGTGDFSVRVALDGIQVARDGTEWLDGDVVDRIALHLGASDDWQPEDLNCIADYCGNVREHPGDPVGGGGGYAARFEARQRGATRHRVGA